MTFLIRRNRTGQWQRNPTLGRFLVILLCLLFWEVIARKLADPRFVSSPSAVVRTMLTKTLVDAAVLSAIGTTLYELLTAFALAVVSGVALGLIVGADERLRRALFPLVLMLYAIPQVTVLPLFVMVFGVGGASKVAFGFTHGIFPMVVNVVAGLNDVNPILLRSARSMGAKRLHIVRRVMLPHLMPSLFVGMRMSMAMTLLGVILAELYASINGVGYFAQLYAESFDAAQLYALILALALIAALLNELTRATELWMKARRQELR